MLGWQIWYDGGGAMNNKPPYRKWSPRLLHDLQQVLCDLPEPLQWAVHRAVARCQPQNIPRLYANDWLEELYHEAIVAALEAQRRYDSSKGCSLYSWGLQVIGQRLQVFCNRVWDAARHECDCPCDEETGEEIEFPDERALEQMKEGLLVCMVREALHELDRLSEQIGLWYLLDEFSEREIAEKLGKSKSWVHKRLEQILGYLRSRLGGEWENRRRE